MAQTSPTQASTASSTAFALGIGPLGALSIAVNNLTGPGLLDLPSTFQRSGLIPSFLVVAAISALSSMTCLSVAKLVQRGGNGRFDRDVQYSSLFPGYGRQTQALFFLAIMSQVRNGRKVGERSDVEDTSPFAARRCR